MSTPNKTTVSASIPITLYDKLVRIGIIDPSKTRDSHVGASDYSKKVIQPWSIWVEYALNSWDADIVKRTLRNKVTPNMSTQTSRIEDYEKIQHVCSERIRQLRLELLGPDPKSNLNLDENSKSPKYRDLAGENSK